jgi:hypothetical protein
MIMPRIVRKPMVGNYVWCFPNFTLFQCATIAIQFVLNRSFLLDYALIPAGPNLRRSIYYLLSRTRQLKPGMLAHRASL